jgi:hypothetical protein
MNTHTKVTLLAPVVVTMKTIIHGIQPFVPTLLALTSPWQPVCRLVPGAGCSSSASLVVNTQT